MTEAEFLDDIVELAKLYGWMVWHSVPARIRKDRWVTPGKGDYGFPDLCLSHPDRGTFFAELKVGHNKPSEKQVKWIASINHSGGEAHLWYPRDMEAIIDRLTRKPIKP